MIHDGTRCVPPLRFSVVKALSKRGAKSGAVSPPPGEGSPPPPLAVLITRAARDRGVRMCGAPRLRGSGKASASGSGVSGARGRGAGRGRPERKERKVVPALFIKRLNHTPCASLNRNSFCKSN